MEDFKWLQKLDDEAPLPAGFTPDLSSKWDIIQNGLQHQARAKRVQKRFTILLILLLAGSGALYISGLRNEKENVSASIPFVKEIPPAQPRAEEKFNTASEPIQISKENIPGKKNIVKTPETKKDNMPVVQEELKEIFPSISLSISEGPKDTIMAAQSPPVARAAKPKTFQKDFPPLVNTKLGGKVAAKGEKLSFEFFKRKSLEGETPKPRQLTTEL